MILELVRIRTLPDRSEAFPAALAEARPLIAQTDGFLGLEVRRCLEEPEIFLLLIQWRELADHLDGFRGSERYSRWRELLSPLYAAPPEVFHYHPIGDD